MIRRLYGRLPGPTPVKLLLSLLIVLVALVALGFVFERAGDLLDNGGVIQ